MVKCVLLLSGGLDSTLAGAMLGEMGVEVHALSVTSPFCTCTPKGQGCSAARVAAAQIGIPLRSVAGGQDYLQAVKHPRHGRGRGANPCIDCRIHIFKLAAAYMRELGADFVATGEVLGERPMSQHREALMRIERESGLQGLVLRPLSARLLPPTRAEEDGVVDRERLLAIQGRRRQPQMQLASKLGIKDYLCPGGGCLLTQREFAAKFLDLLDHDPDFDMPEAVLLRHGRHFRLPAGGKAIVGRNAEENERLAGLAGERYRVLTPTEPVPGPTVLFRGNDAGGDLERAARLLAFHVKDQYLPLDVMVQGTTARLAAVQPPPSAEVEAWRIAPRSKKRRRRQRAAR